MEIKPFLRVSPSLRSSGQQRFPYWLVGVNLPSQGSAVPRLSILYRQDAEVGADANPVLPSRGL